jgi:hypothetical protein
VLGEVRSTGIEPTQHRTVRVVPRIRLDRVNEVWLSVTENPAAAGSGGSR